VVSEWARASLLGGLHARSSCVQTRRFPSLPGPPFALDAYVWRIFHIMRNTVVRSLHDLGAAAWLAAR
jgi:hypothetical protein